jgi:hypothetical protein
MIFYCPFNPYRWTVIICYLPLFFNRQRKLLACLEQIGREINKTPICMATACNHQNLLQ